MNLQLIEIGDLIMTFDGIVGVVYQKRKRGIILSTFDDDILIHLKDIKKIRYVKTLCFAHKQRYCKICDREKEVIDDIKRSKQTSRTTRE